MFLLPYLFIAIVCGAELLFRAGEIYLRHANAINNENISFKLFGIFPVRSSWS